MTYCLHPAPSAIALCFLEEDHDGAHRYRTACRICEHSPGVRNVALGKFDAMLCASCSTKMNDWLQLFFNGLRRQFVGVDGVPLGPVDLASEGRQV